MAAGKALTGRRKLFANSVEWIASGAGDLVVLVPTHDADTRAPEHGRAHADASVKYPHVGGQIPPAGVTGADELFYEKNTAASAVAVRHPRTGRPTVFMFKPDDDPGELRERREPPGEPLAVEPRALVADEDGPHPPRSFSTRFALANDTSRTGPVRQGR